MKRESVLLLGASGTMGYAAFRELWKRRDRYDIVILARPSQKNRKLFRPYEKEAGVRSIPGRRTAQGDGFEIVWGDATDYDDVQAAVEGVDWVLNAMAFISPQADYYPEIAKAVNTDAVINVVRAIEAQPCGPEHIKLVHTATVAQTGDRLGGIHWGRVGDPLKPSIFDYYAVTKIAGERAILESDIKHWASLRMTFIMPTNYKSYMGLRDPIMLHQPINSFMENLSDRDAGYGLINCLDIPEDSDFWRRAYNMGGGPGMRCTAYEYANMSCQLLGLSGIEACSERKWFALRNFHMQHYEDSHVLNEYLHHWRDDLDSYWEALRADMPAGMKALGFLCRLPLVRKPVESVAYQMLRRSAEDHPNGTAYWYKQRCDMRISAFYKDYETYEAIPDWEIDMPQLDPEPEWQRLDHGYDESKEQLDLGELQGAARFRGGECLSNQWDGDLYSTLTWRCSFGHEFTGKPYTILKAGHWCPVCVAPPWNFDAVAKHDSFFAQVWTPNHDEDEDNFYPEDCLQDIAGADRDQQ
jgi:nucleoside-diphosphate-sugar epimerase